MTDTTLLSVKEVSNRYVSRPYGIFGKKTIKPVLNNINLEILQGELFGLVGESGCGKTTLGKCILGLIDYRGEIVIDGLVQRRGPSLFSVGLEMAEKVQGVFQNPAASLNPVKRIGSIMEEPLIIHKERSARERRRRVDEALCLVGLEPSYKNRRPHELSSGQKQRVCIGRSLMLRPKLLIADEAISSLDVSVGAQILNLFRELHEREGQSILFISHNIDAVEYLCDRIAVMKDGQLEER